MYWLRIFFLQILLFIVGNLPRNLYASERSYFEELDRVAIPNPNEITGTHFKVTPDGRYVLVSLLNDDHDFINIYQLQLNEGLINKLPVSSIRYDAFNDLFLFATGIGVANGEDEKSSKAYVYSVATQQEILISGYTINSSGSPSAIDQGYVLIAEGYSRDTALFSSKAIEIQEDIMFSVTDKGVAVIKVNCDGSLYNSGQILPLPDSDKQQGVPATLLYIPQLHRLFIGMDCLNDIKEPCKENTFLLIYSFKENNNFNNFSIHYTSFDKNASYPAVITALAQSRGKKNMVVMVASLVDSESGYKTSGIMIIDPVSLQTTMNNITFFANDLLFSTGADRIYVSSRINDQTSYGLVAYDIANNFSLLPVFGSGLQTELNHYALAFTPDGCHLLATAGSQSDQSSGAGYLILYRINDSKLKCIAPPPPPSSSWILIGSISAATVITITGVVTLSFCYLARKYGARKGYTPIND